VIVPKIALPLSTHDLVLVIVGQMTETQDHVIDGYFLPVLKEINMHNTIQYKTCNATYVTSCNAQFCFMRQLYTFVLALRL